MRPRRFLAAALVLALLLAVLANLVMTGPLGRSLDLKDWLVSLATAAVVGLFLALLMLRPVHEPDDTQEEPPPEAEGFDVHVQDPILEDPEEEPPRRGGTR